MKKKEVKRNKNLKIVKLSKRKKSKKTRLLIRRIFILILCAAVAASLFLGISLLLTKVFSVHNITVEGDTIYSHEEITKYSEINRDSSFVFTNTRTAEEKIYNSLPYIDAVKVTKELPDKIKIAVEPAIAQYVLYSNNEYLIISQRDKLLEKCQELPPELIDIIGVKSSVSEMGKIVYENEKIKNLFTEIANALKDKGLNGIKAIDISDTDNIIVNYDNRLKIEMGTGDDIEYKALTSKEIIMNKIGSTEKGTLNLKNLKKENRYYFMPEG